jgi:DNA repair exonuclease SbcCD ATPase subunit
MSAIWTPTQARRELESVFTERQATVLTKMYAEHYSQLVRVSDFTELKLIVKDLAEAQHRTEARVEELAVAQQRLAVAQERTEARVEELAAAQQRTEARMEELAAAQQRTEARMEELAVAQQRTEARMEELTAAEQRLTEAQQRTEARMEAMAAAIQRLTEGQQEMRQEMREMRREIGGLSTTVGYRLEDEAFRGLPALLARDHGLEVQGRLRRAYVTDTQGRSLEVNILGTARRDGQEVTIVGESKAQLSKNKVDEFIARRLHPLRGVFAQIFPVLVTYMISEPDAEAYAREAGIVVYYSYDF